MPDPDIYSILGLTSSPSDEPMSASSFGATGRVDLLLLTFPYLVCNDSLVLSKLLFCYPKLPVTLWSIPNPRLVSSKEMIRSLFLMRLLSVVPINLRSVVFISSVTMESIVASPSPLLPPIRLF